MRCDKINELMSEHLDGHLDCEGQRLLSEHLGQCVKCRTDFSALKDTVNMVRDIGLEQPPSDLLSKVRAKIDEEDARRTGLAFETVKEEGLNGIWTIFNSPQSRMAIAATFLMAVGIYGFMTKFEKNDQGRGSGMSDDAILAIQKPSAVVPVIPIQSESMPKTVSPAVTKAKQDDKLMPRKAANVMPMMEEKSCRSSALDSVPVQKKAGPKNQDRELSLAVIPAKSGETQNIHSRSIPLSQPAVMNQQNQNIVTSMSREQGKATLAESAASRQVGVMSAQSRQVQQVSNAWLNQQKLNTNIQEQVREISVVTDDVEGVISILRKQLSRTVGKESMPVPRIYGQDMYAVTTESAGKTVVDIEILLLEYQALIEDLKTKGEVTVAANVDLQAGKLKTDHDAYSGTHVKLRINIILKK